MLPQSTDEVVAIRNASRFYGRGNATIVLDDLACSEDDSNLLNCSSGGPQMHTCDRTEVAGVKCGGNCILHSFMYVY